jgi:hypothetical protein
MAALAAVTVLETLAAAADAAAARAGAQAQSHSRCWQGPMALPVGQLEVVL